MDSLTDRFFNWVWQSVVGPAINNTFAFIPLWVWVILIGVGVGFLFKKFGWQGVVGGLVAGALFFAYVLGWRQRDSLSKKGVPEEEIQDPIGNIGLPPSEEDPAPKPIKPKPKGNKPKIRYNDTAKRWEEYDPVSKKWFLQ